MTTDFAAKGSRWRRWQACPRALEAPSILLTPVARVAAATAVHSETKEGWHEGPSTVIVVGEDRGRKSQASVAGPRCSGSGRDCAPAELHGPGLRGKVAHTAQAAQARSAVEEKEAFRYRRLESRGYGDDPPK